MIRFFLVPKQGEEGWSFKIHWIDSRIEDLFSFFLPLFCSPCDIFTSRYLFLNSIRSGLIICVRIKSKTFLPFWLINYSFLVWILSIVDCIVFTFPFDACSQIKCISDFYYFWEVRYKLVYPIEVKILLCLVKF